jgi:alanine racemase
MQIKKKHQYRSWVEVDLDNFISNLNEIKRLIGPHVDFMQIVKADAYGHGAIEISQVALKNGAKMLGVANADEGVQLRVSGIDAHIVILGPSTEFEIEDIIKYNLTPSVSDLTFARKLQKALKKSGKTINIHIEVDTGMGRGGTMHGEALQLIDNILTLPDINLEGIFSHLASSEVNSYCNMQQWQLFSNLLKEIESRNIRIKIRHMNNSGAILNFPQFSLEMVRPGIMSYGIYPAPETEISAVLSPVMSFKTTIILIKDFTPGCGIGYNSTYVTNKITRIATIPVGYGDGFGLTLSNLGEALINGKRAPVVGRVSMDLCTIDVTNIPYCAVGDEVVLLGQQGNEYIGANEIANKVKTISYEVLCAIGKRAPRIFLQKGETDAVEPRLRRIFIPGEEKSLARIDNIIHHCFQARACSEELGHAIYYEMFENLFGKKYRQLELRTGFRYDIEIAHFPEIAEKNPGGNAYFHVNTRIEYRKTIKSNVFMIGCALNNRQLSALMDDPQCEYCWLMGGGNELFMERDFRVEHVRIDDEDIPITTAKLTERGYEIWCSNDELTKKINKEVEIIIEIVTKKAKNNNIFPVYLVYPTRGVGINFNYMNTALKSVHAESFFAGRHPSPSIRNKNKSISINISDKEWIFPTSGVIFIWDILQPLKKILS